MRMERDRGRGERQGDGLHYGGCWAMTTLLLLAILSADFSQVRKVDSAMAPVYRAGIAGNIMPAGVDTLSAWWLASSPTIGQLGTGATVSCTAAATSVANQTPFCPAGVSPGSGCADTLSLYSTAA